MNSVKVIAFDADDTLWVNEPYFQETEKQFCSLLEDYLPHHTVSRELLKTEMENISYYGYGVKSFMLSMIETAMRISNGSLDLKVIDRILELGKELLQHPIELLPGVEEVLQELQGKFRLVMATKGDLLDQEQKLIRSGLEKYFHHIEIVSEKKKPEYQKLISHLDVKPEEFAMVGNSMKSDILPVVELGGWGIHVPYHTTWEYEKVELKVEHERLRKLDTISEVLEFFGER